MEALIYVGKSSLVVALFYCCFQLFLRNETFFAAKRWFLLAGIAITLIFPFVILKRIVATSVPGFDIDALVDATANAETITEATNWWFVGIAIYAVGCVFFLIRFLVQLLSLRTLINKGELRQQDGFKMVRVNADTSAFSFFKYIVYNPKLHTTTELETILEHEKAHSNQKHSIDMLLVHFLCILQWANPLAWLYKKTVSQNLEFLADVATTTTLKNKKEYQYLLLHQSNPGLASISFTNTFFNSVIKKRIVMLNKNKSKKQSVLKMGFVLPFLAIALLTLNTKTIAQTKSVTAEINTQKIELQITAETTDEELKAISKLTKEDQVTLRFTKIIRDSNKNIISIASDFNYKDDFSGTRAVSGDKPIKTFYFYTTKDKKDVIKEIGYKSGPKEDITAYQSGHKLTIVGRNSAGNTKPLIVLDGIEMDESFDANQIDPQNIAQVSVLKGAKAEDAYGTKGEHGVVVITSKNIEVNVQSDPSKTKTVTHRIVTDKKPLIVIDGKQMKPSYDMDQMEPDNIKSINVLKGESATEKYGKKGKNGVVEIITKK